ncbi:MAG: hypothetical protein ROO76_11350 [Terriglobia bacterium]|jgi:TolA-binding protein|nr:hypothetical protein [Terriglobia bacterium]
MNAQFRNVVVALALGGVCFAQTTTTTTTRKKTVTTTHHRAVPKRAPAATTEDLQRLQETMQEQIDQLKQQLADRDQKLQQVQQELNQAQTASQQAQQKASNVETTVADQQQKTAAELNEVHSTLASTTQTVQEDQKKVATLSDRQNKLSDLANGKIKLGGQFFGGFTHYTDTGFGPQWIANVNQLGPGNAGANIFDVTRAYINFFYTPNDMVTLRITPNIYRQIDGTSGAIPNGTGAQVGSSENGNLTFRLKYAYVDFNNLFKGSKAFRKAKLTFGQTQNPLIDWEEGLSTYRYTYLVPWNYMGLSSTYVGAKLHGPVEINGKEYLDYDLGVFTTASFHAIETSDKKQLMARLTWYPFGTKSDRSGFGITAFENYGYNTKLPSQVSTPLNRLAILGHYQTDSKKYQIAFEYDLGHNAVSTGNMFSGTGPVAGGPYDDFNTLAGSVLSGTHTRQQGFATFGHAALGGTPFSLFGFYQYFQPNTRYAGDNPLDFARTVGGISYHVTKYFDFAVGNENFHWVHPQGLVPGGDSNGIAIWTQYTF